MSNTCDNCGDGSGWIYDLVYGYVCCADCNDDAQKPKPSKPFWGLAQRDVGDHTEVHALYIAKGEPSHSLSTECWCKPVLDFRAPNGNELLIHKQVQ